MQPFDFLNNIKRNLEGYFTPSLNQTKGTLEEYFPSQSLNFRMDKSPNVPELNIPSQNHNPQSQPQPQQQVMPQQSQPQMQSPVVSNPMTEFTNSQDQLLPTLLALMETLKVPVSSVPTGSGGFVSQILQRV